MARGGDREVRVGVRACRVLAGYDGGVVAAAAAVEHPHAVVAPVGAQHTRSVAATGDNTPAAADACGGRRRRRRRARCAAGPVGRAQGQGRGGAWAPRHERAGGQGRPVGDQQQVFCAGHDHPSGGRELRAAGGAVAESDPCRPAESTSGAEGDGTRRGLRELWKSADLQRPPPVHWLSERHCSLVLGSCGAGRGQRPGRAGSGGHRRGRRVRHGSSAEGKRADARDTPAAPGSGGRGGAGRLAVAWRGACAREEARVGAVGAVGCLLGDRLRRRAHQRLRLTSPPPRGRRRRHVGRITQGASFETTPWQHRWEGRDLRLVAVALGKRPAVPVHNVDTVCRRT